MAVRPDMHERAKASGWYLTTEVADLLRIDTKTVSRWCRQGLIPRGEFMITPGGHFRIARRWVRKRLGLPAD